MIKVVYIIPGFTDKIGQKKYTRIIPLFKAKGFKTIPITISWKNKTMSGYVEQFLQRYNPTPKDKVYLFGFSFGAMIAFISSSAGQTKPKRMILCSLAPFFKEDLPFLKKSEKRYNWEKENK